MKTLRPLPPASIAPASVKLAAGLTRAFVALVIAGGLILATDSRADLIPSGGMIYDDDLNITWTSDSNSGCDSGPCMGWDGAMARVASLEFNGYSGWRLPTVSEMSHLYYEELGGVMWVALSAHHNANYALFTFRPEQWNWSSEESAPGGEGAYGFDFESAAFAGNVMNIYKSCCLYVWLVHDGQVTESAVPTDRTSWGSIKSLFR